MKYKVLSKKECARALKELRVNAGVSQALLASKTGISRAQIAMIETGKSLPSIGFAQKIALYFEVAPWSFFYSDVA